MERKELTQRINAWAEENKDYIENFASELLKIDEMVAKNQLLADFKAVQSGNVWCTTQNMYQESMAIGSMIADMHTAFVTDVSQNTDTRYLFKLNE